ncbi:MAG: alpha/beta fold hydrolase [Acidimicrobiales bacterium]
MYSPLMVDVSGSVKLDGDHRLSTWVFAPGHIDGPAPLLFCLPGGSYTKAYWHLEVPGRPGYSFAEHMATAGMVVVAVDHLGVGESSRHPRAIDLTPEVIAAANAAAFDEVAARAANGTLVEGLPAIALGPAVGVGHSMGGMLTIFQQSLFGSFDAIATLGYGTMGPIADPEAMGTGAFLPSRESIMEAAATGALDQIPLLDRSTPALRHHFYWDDVPDEVIAADDLTNTPVPGVCGPLSIVPFIASDHAWRVRCPVFIGLGERDSTWDHRDEPRAYASSNDVTLYILQRSAHCHNTAGTRHLLWDRLAGWVRALAS